MRGIGTARQREKNGKGERNHEGEKPRRREAEIRQIYMSDSSEEPFGLFPTLNKEHCKNKYEPWSPSDF